VLDSGRPSSSYMVHYNYEVVVVLIAAYNGDVSWVPSFRLKFSLLSTFTRTL
jgi:hypothetical protein